MENTIIQTLAHNSGNGRGEESGNPANKDIGGDPIIPSAPTAREVWAIILLLLIKMAS